MFSCSYVLVFFCRPVECPSTLNTAWETLLTETQYDAQVRLTVSLICVLILMLTLMPMLTTYCPIRQPSVATCIHNVIMSMRL